MQKTSVKVVIDGIGGYLIALVDGHFSLEVLIIACNYSLLTFQLSISRKVLGIRYDVK